MHRLSNILVSTSLVTEYTESVSRLDKITAKCARFIYTLPPLSISRDAIELRGVKYIFLKKLKKNMRGVERQHCVVTALHPLSLHIQRPRCLTPPTHNREPYDTRLSDTMVAHPSASS